MTAAHNRNRIICIEIRFGIPPHELWHGEKPDLSPFSLSDSNVGIAFIRDIFWDVTFSEKESGFESETSKKPKWDVGIGVEKESVSQPASLKMP